MRLLLDTISNLNGLALIGPDERIITRNFDRRTQSSLLLHELAEVLSDLGVETAQIDELSINVGPGSFTGIKVGLSIAQTFSLVHSTRLSAFTTFDILAHQAKLIGIEHTGILVYAFQNEYFSAQSVNDLWEFKVLKQSQVVDQNWLYDGPTRYCKPNWNQLPSECAMDWSKFLVECKFDAKINPFYGKQSTAEINLQQMSGGQN